MHPTLRTIVFAATLTAALAPAALAGGMSARVEGPAKDGTYMVRTYACSNPKSVQVSAWAEGVVNGERRTLPLVLKQAKAEGVFSFQRTWPKDGHWLVRLAFPTGRAAVTVAEIGSDGRVKDNSFVWESDGKHECDTKLAAATK